MLRGGEFLLSESRAQLGDSSTMISTFTPAARARSMPRSKPERALLLYDPFFGSTQSDQLMLILAHLAWESVSAAAVWS